MNKGTVRFYNFEKGFGFIRKNGSPNNPNNDYFFHFSGIKNGVSANENDRVTFDVIADKNKIGSYRAVNITILPDE